MCIISFIIQSTNMYLTLRLSWYDICCSLEWLGALGLMSHRLVRVWLSTAAAADLCRLQSASIPLCLWTLLIRKSHDPATKDYAFLYRKRIKTQNIKIALLISACTLREGSSTIHLNARVSYVHTLTHILKFRLSLAKAVIQGWEKKT